MTMPVVSRVEPDRHENPKSGSSATPGQSSGYSVGLFGKLIDGN